MTRIVENNALKFEMFPDFLIRLGNGNAENLTKLNFKNKIVVEIESYIASENKRKYLRDNLCELLYNKIGTIEDVNYQNTLLTLKRNIFNDKAIEPAKLEVLKSLFSMEEHQLFSSYFNLVHELEICKKEIEVKLEREYEVIKRNYWHLIDNGYLRSGLLLSSTSLFDELSKYLSSPVSVDKKKENQLEQSLLKYLSRIHTKTSPLGLFTSVGWGTIEELNNIVGFSTKGEYSTECNARVNNFIFRHLNYLWFNNRKFSVFFNLKLNPTLSVNNNAYNYMSTNGNTDTFQIIQKNDFLEYLFALPFTTEDLSVNKIIDQLIEKDIFERKDEVELLNYIHNLINLGFLEFDIEVNSLDPFWYKKMVAVFNKIGRNNEFVEAIDLLNLIGYSVSIFNPKEYFNSKSILDSLSINISNYINKLESDIAIQAESVEPSNGGAETKISSKPFYIEKQNILKVDSKLTNKFSFNRSDIEPVIIKLDKLMCLFSDFNYFKKNRELILNYFRQKYPENSSVNILTLYNDFFKDYKLPLEQMKKGDSNPSVFDDFVDIKASINEKWAIFYENASVYFNQELKQIDNLMEVHFSLEKIKTNLFSKNPTSEIKGSFGTHMQFYTSSPSNKITAVVNSVFPGYGKLASRFLYMFDDSLRQNIYDWNARLITDKETLIDNKDSNYFNANIHPRLLPNELYTAGMNRKKENHEISVKDIEVFYNNESDSLDVKDKSGNRVNFFDLGFELDERRSNLFSFINLFSFSEWSNIFPIITAINKSYNETHNPNENRIKYKPRIICDDILVLQRKSWIINKELIPFQDKNESILDYYIRLTTWKNKLSIPNDVFVSIPENSDPKKINSKAQKDDYKPLYISFNSHLFLKLFLKILSKTEEAIKIEEMLPKTDNMLNHNNIKNPAEFLFQWYKYDNNSK